MGSGDQVRLPGREVRLFYHLMLAQFMKLSLEGLRNVCFGRISSGDGILCKKNLSQEELGIS